jgi:hypothetical protein
MGSFPCNNHTDRIGEGRPVMKQTRTAPLVGTLPSDEYYKLYHPYLSEVSFPVFDLHFPEVSLAEISRQTREEGNDCEADNNS